MLRTLGDRHPLTAGVYDYVGLNEMCRKQFAEAERFFRRSLDIFRESPEDAQRLAEIGDTPADPQIDAVELAAWTMVANTMLNRDDFVNK